MNAGWVDSSDRSQCMKCELEFSMWVRKHHCRRCGEIFCDDCSKYRSIVPVEELLSPPLSLLLLDPLVPHRVCESCSHKPSDSIFKPKSVPVPLLNTYDYNEGSLFDIYEFKLPLDIEIHKTITISLGTKELYVDIPENIRPGQSIRIRTPSVRNKASESSGVSSTPAKKPDSAAVQPSSRVRANLAPEFAPESESEAVASTFSSADMGAANTGAAQNSNSASQTDDISQVNSPIDERLSTKAVLEEGQSSSETPRVREAPLRRQREHTGVGHRRVCLRCASDNHVSAVNCISCNQSLHSESRLIKTRVMKTHVLELEYGVPTKEFEVRVPICNNCDKTFFVILESKVWTVICPMNCCGGDIIVVAIPADASADGSSTPNTPKESRVPPAFKAPSSSSSSSPSSSSSSSSNSLVTPISKPSDPYQYARSTHASSHRVSEGSGVVADVREGGAGGHLDARVTAGAGARAGSEDDDDKDDRDSGDDEFFNTLREIEEDLEESKDCGDDFYPGRAREEGDGDGGSEGSVQFNDLLHTDDFDEIVC